MKSALVTLYLLLSWTCVSVTSSCGGDLVVAGASSANRLVRTWLLGYNTLCPTARVTIDDSSSSTGAARVCGVRRKATAVDIGSMRRPMNRLEASSNDGWRFQCERSTRSTIQVSTMCLEESSLVLLYVTNSSPRALKRLMSVFKE